MRTVDFDYPLPEHLIASRPLEQRDLCRLLHLDRRSGAVSHHLFRDIAEFLKKGDRLVLNDTRVLPARLFCRKSNDLRIELLFSEPVEGNTWKVLMKPARRVKVGSQLEIEGCSDGVIRVDDVLADGDRVVTFISNDKNLTVQSMLEKFGHMPLPPYIRREDQEFDREAYQTVYGIKSGAVAAPTAGLHFTKELLSELSESGIDLSYVTLHAGIGTFRPVKEENPANHPMHEEYYELSQKTVEEILKTKENGGRIVAVGTTVVRVLEHCASTYGQLRQSSGKTKLLILPSYRFKAIDGLITNFHLPKSTLLMLVCAFAGQKQVLDAYNQAVVKEYRFFSYGDAMLLL